MDAILSFFYRSAAVLQAIYDHELIRLVRKHVRLGLIQGALIGFLCLASWVIKQTVFQDFLWPAMVKVAYGYAAMLLPEALLPWSGAFVLTGLFALLGLHTIRAYLQGNLIDKHAARHYGSILYWSLGWLLPISTFIFACYGGYSPLSAAYATGGLATFTGILTLSFYPFLNALGQSEMQPAKATQAEMQMPATTYSSELTRSPAIDDLPSMQTLDTDSSEDRQTLRAKRRL